MRLKSDLSSKIKRARGVLILNFFSFKMLPVEAGSGKQPSGKCWQFVKTFVHIVFLSHNLVTLVVGAIVLLNSVLQEKDNMSDLFYYSYGFVTNWNVLFQTMFLSLALLHDALEWVDKHDSNVGRSIKYWRDVVFSGLVVPVTLFVTGMFWSVYLIDRELVFPSVFDEIVPWWFNHCVHTNIFIVICVETLLQPRRRPADWKMENILVITAIVAYAVVYYSIYFFSHRWLYQVFAIMTWWQVCLFQCLIWSSSYFFYTIQFPINRLVHGSADDDEDVVKTIGEVDKEMVNGVKNYDNGKVSDIVTDDYGINTVSKVDDDVNKEKVENGIINDGVMNINNCATEESKETFDKSWSLKYRTQRSQFEISSL